jgi:hypothetical protein
MNHATSAGPSAAIHYATNIYAGQSSLSLRTMLQKHTFTRKEVYALSILPTTKPPTNHRSATIAQNPVAASERREAINYAANYNEGQPVFVSDEVTKVTAHNGKNSIIFHNVNVENIHGIPRIVPPVPELPSHSGSAIRQSARSGVALSSRMQKATSQRQGPKLATLDEMVPSSKPEAKAHLVKLFREEILYDHTKRQEWAAGLQSKQLSVHGQRMKQLKQAMENFGKVGDLPHLVMSNITRQDWKGLTGFCIYIIDLDGGPRSGPAKSLAAN